MLIFFTKHQLFVDQLRQKYGRLMKGFNGKNKKSVVDKNPRLKTYNYDDLKEHPIIKLCDATMDDTNLIPKVKK